MRYNWWQRWDPHEFYEPFMLVSESINLVLDSFSKIVKLKMDRFSFVKHYYIKKNGAGYFKSFVDLDNYKLKCTRCDVVFSKSKAKYKVILECEKCEISVFRFVCPVCGHMEYR